MKLIASLFILILGLGQELTTVRIDGVLGSEEWSGAQVYDLIGGGKLRLWNTNGILHGALTSEQGFWTHMYLSDGETVTVMHTSAALDAVTYRRSGGKWHTRDKFEFELRDSVYNQVTERRMREYYDRNGWVANNVRLGKYRCIEFKINTGQWRSPLYFACVLAGQGIHPFPVHLNDHTVLPRLVQGYTPDTLHFAPDRWHRLR